MILRSCWIVFLIEIVFNVHGHGRMEDPPARNAAWRYGFEVPANYDDVGLNCGGLSVQKFHGGKCGVCGDAYGGSRDHETGGKYATNIIVRHYLSGALIDVKILLSANHKGFMEFRLCPVRNDHVEVTQECLDSNLLHIDGHGKQYLVDGGIDLIYLRVHLPVGLWCNRCVFQWRYHAGNNWGRHSLTGQSCLGCGPQEEFYNCADISISPKSNPLNFNSTMTTTTTTTSLTEYRPSTVINRRLDKGFNTGAMIVHCYPTNEALKPLIGIENWCFNLCAIHCPPTLCVCVRI